ncbi:MULTISPECIES: hypothetical protein [Bacillus]|uniref:hypothetical protein n=1 Tax=Bacillus TaxID=1386 RepID=UPI0005C577A2|nr:hypothetical protein [Bacillus pumilus]MBB6600670.1 hypothetical protein [Bacillus pumilus]MBU8574380.1 hypothetical protein [Bacillus pumilus]MCY7576574.1 hypothetical protein [Bacillus pumilus]OBS86289.1 hypothetical protein BAY68_05505 [Bacillus pumilus]PRS64585.1 hypothetical protein C6X98_11840 [Bacillus pumilus]
MKKIIICIIFMMTIIVGLFFIQPLKNQISFLTVKNTNLTELKVGHLKLGLKKEKSSENEWMKTSNSNYFKVNRRKEIVAISLENNQSNINNTINIHSTKKDIYDYFGENTYRRDDDQGYNIIGYKDSEHDIKIEFFYLDKNLERIIISEFKE